MAVLARELPEPQPSPARVEISPAKGSGILGVIYAGLALLLGASLASYHPTDPSFLRQSTSPLPGPRNLIGRVGAEIGAGGFGLLGWVALLIPVLLAVLAWRRLRVKARPRVVGRSSGAVLLLFTLPGLSQLLAPALVWRGESLDSGGALGVLLAHGLTARVNAAGALVLLGSLFVVGLVLLVQSSLGEVLARWQRRLAYGVLGLLAVADRVGPQSRAPSSDSAAAIARSAVAGGRGIGCEVSHARKLVYADGVDLESREAAVPVGLSCRLCERMDCEQRAFPPLQHPLQIHENVRGVSFFSPVRER